MGDRSDFVARLFDQHHRSLFRFLLRFTHRREDAEDLTQDVFLRVLHGANGYQPRGLERAWLFRIARNLLVDHNRRNAGAGAMPGGVDEEPHTETRTIESIALEEALAKLTILEREAVILRDVVGLSYREIAEATEVSPEAVAARLYRARSTLRAVLSADLPRDSDGAKR